MVNIYPELESLINKCGMEPDDVCGLTINAEPRKAEVELQFYIKDEKGNHIIEDGDIKRGAILKNVNVRGEEVKIRKAYNVESDGGLETIIVRHNDVKRFNELRFRTGHIFIPDEEPFRENVVYRLMSISRDSLYEQVIEEWKMIPDKDYIKGYEPERVY